MASRRCDHCKGVVYVVGKLEPRYVHAHGSVFCMTTRATVKGREAPTHNPSSVPGES